MRLSDMPSSQSLVAELELELRILELQGIELSATCEDIENVIGGQRR